MVVDVLFKVVRLQKGLPVMSSTHVHVEEGKGIGVHDCMRGTWAERLVSSAWFRQRAAWADAAAVGGVVLLATREGDVAPLPDLHQEARSAGPSEVVAAEGVALCSDDGVLGAQHDHHRTIDDARELSARQGGAVQDRGLYAVILHIQYSGRGPASEGHARDRAARRVHAASEARIATHGHALHGVQEEEDVQGAVRLGGLTPGSTPFHDRAVQDGIAAAACMVARYDDKAMGSQEFCEIYVACPEGARPVGEDDHRPTLPGHRLAHPHIPLAEILPSAVELFDGQAGSVATDCIGVLRAGYELGGSTATQELGVLVGWHLPRLVSGWIPDLGLQTSRATIWILSGVVIELHSGNPHRERPGRCPRHGVNAVTRCRCCL
mmetsp:Transcript_96856/g.289302  ORF Transcript_96856/g.289302 Transcript_96856/m.289302 type:complete len:379 (+) Transcript_96856:82-1218(+)